MDGRSRGLAARVLQAGLAARAQQGSTYGYPFAEHNSGTIHDHLLHWKVDADIAGTPNSIRLDRVVLEERLGSEGFGDSSSWFTKRVQQTFPATEAEATLLINGSSKALPGEAQPPTLYYIINTNATNRWGSARGYRLQHTQSTPQVLPPTDRFGNTQGFAWTKYKVAVTARHEWESSSSSPLNQPLPYAPIINFDKLLEEAQPPATGSGSNSSGSSSKGDNIVQQDLVLWVTSGLQHLPGSEDAPVTPTTGPAIGFWLRPFNFFDESAAAGQPGMVYIPAITEQEKHVAAAAAAAGNDAFSLATAAANSSTGSTVGSSGAAARTGAGGSAGLAQAGLGRDDAALITLTDPAVLIAARRGIQPYMGVPLRQQCLPNMPSVPLNGTFAPFFSSPFQIVPAGPGTGTASGGGAANDSAAGAVSRNGSMPGASSATYG